MYRWDIINKIIKKENYKRYLEVGYGNGDCFDKIEIEEKVGTDIGYGVPEKNNCDYIMKSIDFFKNEAKSLPKFDIIFIDASHHYEDVLVDINNSLDVLNENGTIVMHDCNPPNEDYQQRKQ